MNWIISASFNKYYTRYRLSLITVDLYYVVVVVNENGLLGIVAYCRI